MSFMHKLQQRKHQVRIICQIYRHSYAAFRTFNQLNQTLRMIIGPYHKRVLTT